MTDAFLIGAKRTPVAPRHGALSALSAPELGSICIHALLSELDLPGSVVGTCILSNALYGGGNPARVSALAASIPEHVPSITIDTQCCGGLDAILMARDMIVSGSHDLVLAGGLESYSTSPRRFRRSLDGGEDEEYQRPPFTPWTDCDPDMLEAAAELARAQNILREDQQKYAQRSHEMARGSRSRLKSECVSIDAFECDDFTRKLSDKLLQKLPIIAGDEQFGLTTATTAVEADGAAICAIVSSDFLKSHPQFQNDAPKIIGGDSVGSDPTMPGLAPVFAVRETLKKCALKPAQLDVVELMEAFAPQAMACIDLCEFEPEKVNLGGGALARGHPIGASGAINAVRLYHEMIFRPDSELGLATIAGAGGLGSTLVLAR